MRVCVCCCRRGSAVDLIGSTARLHTIRVHCRLIRFKRCTVSTPFSAGDGNGGKNGNCSRFVARGTQCKIPHPVSRQHSCHIPMDRLALNCQKWLNFCAPPRYTLRRKPIRHVFLHSVTTSLFCRFCSFCRLTITVFYIITLFCMLPSYHLARFLYISDDIKADLPLFSSKV